MGEIAGKLALDENGAAQALTVSVAMLRKLRGQGEGPRVTRIGRCVRYRIEDLAAFLKRGAANGEARGK